MAAKSEHRSLLLEEVARVRDAAAKSTEPCLTAKAMSLLDERVIEKILEHLGRGERLIAMRCLDGIGIPEQRGVLFEFLCPEKVICLISPAFLVIVDFINKRVIDIIDPYLDHESVGTSSQGPDTRGAMPFALGIPSDAANVSFAESELAGMHVAETDFLAQRGLPPGFGGGGFPTTLGTPSFSPTSTRSWTSGYRTIWTHTHFDRTPYAHPDYKTDFSSDFRIDRTLDPGGPQDPFGPGGPWTRQETSQPGGPVINPDLIDPGVG
jgi:hypothetical protein